MAAWRRKHMGTHLMKIRHNRNGDMAMVLRVLMVLLTAFVSSAVLAQNGAVTMTYQAIWRTLVTS